MDHLEHSHWYLQSMVVRRDVLLRIELFDTALTIAEDLDVIARLALEGEFGFNKEVLVKVYRRTEPTINLGGPARGSMQACKCFEKVFEHLRKDRRLRFMERLALRKVTSASQRALGNLRLAQANARQARAYLGFFAHYLSVLKITDQVSCILNIFQICTSSYKKGQEPRYDIGPKITALSGRLPAAICTSSAAAWLTPV